MAIFGKKDRDTMMDVIRCDEEDYLIWKWRPSGAANSTARENSIRWGSSLRVKDGEVAVFVYKQKEGASNDFIVGPCDETIRTSNFPVLASILGTAFGGGSPFQAEVYFINLAGNIHQEFGVPYFSVVDADPRFENLPVQVGVGGSYVFRITDYRSFIKRHRLIDFDMGKFRLQVRDALLKNVKGIVNNAPSEHGMRVVQIERKLLELNDIIEPRIRKAFQDSFGVELVRFDLSRIEVDKSTAEYEQLCKLTIGLAGAMMIKQNEVSIANLEQTQAINTEHMAESLAIQRKQTQVFQELQSQSQFLAAHQINRQSEVLKSAALSLGEMGAVPGAGSGGGFNPIGMMTGLAVGGAMSGQMTTMMNSAGQTIQQGQSIPPPLPVLQFHVAVDGQSRGPFTLALLQPMIASGQLQPGTQVWRAGMAAWQSAADVSEIATLFASDMPPPVPPPVPPIPPSA